MLISSNSKEAKTWGSILFDVVAEMEVFVERRSDFSLEIRAIRPSAVFGIRREAALPGEGFAWIPDLGSFLKL